MWKESGENLEGKIGALSFGSKKLVQYATILATYPSFPQYTSMIKY
jgi:hypothetical protein